MILILLRRSWPFRNSVERLFFPEFVEIKRPLANEKDFIFRAPVDTMMSYPEMIGWMKAPKALGKFKNLDAFRLKKFDLRIFGIDLSHVGNKKFIFKNITSQLTTYLNNPINYSSLTLYNTNANTLTLIIFWVKFNLIANMIRINPNP